MKLQAPKDAPTTRRQLVACLLPLGISAEQLHIQVRGVRTFEDGLEVEELRIAPDEAQVEDAAAQGRQYWVQSVRDGT